MAQQPNLLAIELVDSGVIVAGAAGPQLFAEEPGYAVQDASALLTGTEAMRRARLKPLFAHSGFWRAPSTESLLRPLGTATTTADLAFAHLQRLVEVYGGGAEGLLLAIPPGYSQQQLGLLLGIASETSLPVRGLVDTTVAACAASAGLAPALHLDLELHQVTLSVLERSVSPAALRRGRFEILPRSGWMALQQVWIELAAAAFVRKTRFDPLHHAATEQHLADLLPQWLGVLRDQPAVEASIDFNGATYTVELQRGQFVSAAESHYREWLRLIQSVRTAGVAVELYLSHRFAVLPGLQEQLATLRDCTLRILDAGAAARGALLHAEAIARPVDALALVTRLPLGAAARTDAVQAASADSEATPRHLRPTHVLLGAQAYAIGADPLTIGWSVPAGRRAVPVEPGTPGVSRVHCTLRSTDREVLVEDQSTYGTFVNDEKVAASVPLRIGDRLRIGSPGIELKLIAVVSGDGAA